MEKSRIDKQMAFALEIDKEKEIKRQTRKTNTEMENDAEHAWHAALMAILLSEYANEKIDVLKTVTMLLIHDVVEIDAGDTYAYDEQGQKSAADREMKAAKRIDGLLPEDQGKKLLNLWMEFEANESAEAKFAHCMDNVQPVMLNAADGGYMWKKNSIPLSKILKRQENTKKGSEVLYKYILENFISKNVENGNIIHDSVLPYSHDSDK